MLNYSQTQFTRFPLINRCHTASHYFPYSCKLTCNSIACFIDYLLFAWSWRTTTYLCQWNVMNEKEKIIHYYFQRIPGQMEQTIEICVALNISQCRNFSSHYKFGWLKWWQHKVRCNDFKWSSSTLFSNLNIKVGMLNCWLRISISN